MSFGIFDLIILGILLISTALGLYRGFINVVLDSAGLIIVLLITILAGPQIYDFALKYIKNELITIIASYGVMYIITSLIVSAIISKIAVFFVMMRFSLLNIVTGGIAGAIRGSFVVTIIYAVTLVISTESYIKSKNLYEMMYEIDDERQSPWLKDSISSPYLHQLLYLMLDVVPKKSLEKIKSPGFNKSEE